MMIQWHHLAHSAALELAAGLGWAGVKEVATSTNVVFQATDAQRRPFAIKVGGPGQDDKLQSELSLCAVLLREGVPVIRPYQPEVMQASVSGVGLLPASIWHWEDGNHSPAGPDSLLALGQALRLLHVADVPNARNRTEFVSLRLAERWSSLLATVNGNPDHPWHSQPEVVAEVAAFGKRAAKAYSQQMARGPQVFGHGDLGITNILLRPGVAVFLDLEFSGREYQYGDFARLLHEVSLGKLDLDDFRLICSGYGSRLPKRSAIEGFGALWPWAAVVWRAEGILRGDFDVQDLNLALERLRDSPTSSPQWRAVCANLPEG